MPIYAYRCQACNHQQDVLQKINEPLLSVCPACQQNTFSKQITAAGFQLKGSGWYVSDFANNSGSSAQANNSQHNDGRSTESSAPCAGACACH